jgi:hypothetical protein
MLAAAQTDAFLDHIGLSEERCLQLAPSDVGPHARKKLKGILNKYQHSKHPFTECYRDNLKRFGSDGAKRVCATLKDAIVGNTKWRKGSLKMHASDDLLIESCDLIDDDVAILLEHVDTRALARLISEGDDDEAS